ncbi:hypothetical protein AB0A74_29355 [Saccharothrix sp. NPDC042600]|uniref:hypothetical protein n=1 Tax=Saccharothrix TaxID=2071 RepID=UPI0033D1ED67|nr:hypothetical protein GCM10017745_23650 [Saccharothrix mutabilis subsp. capreolus]
MHTKTRTSITVEALATLFPHQVATAADLITLGLDHEELVTRRQSGEWQPLLPGVLLLTRKPATRRQRVQAALRYAGPGALLTGLDALHLHGLRTVPATGQVLLLTPRPMEPTDEVKALRPRTTVEPCLRAGFPTAPLLRAVADTTRHLTCPHARRAVLRDAVHRGGIPPSDLARLLSKRGEEIKHFLTTLTPTRPTTPTGPTRIRTAAHPRTATHPGKASSPSPAADAPPATPTPPGRTAVPRPSLRVHPSPTGTSEFRIESAGADGRAGG